MFSLFPPNRKFLEKYSAAHAIPVKGGRLLHGIPYGVKDLLATRGVPTTWGAEPYRNQVFDYDATVVAKLREAGAVLVAKLAMVKLAGGMGYNHADASFTGPGLTPWNTAFWSGGSSSGPGAAVAAGLVPYAIGSETSGSIIPPAAFCGVTGFRPTYGLVSRHGAMALCWTLDKLGPMARTADDAALVLEAMAGPDPLDDSCTGRTFARTATPARPAASWKVAVPKGCTEKVQPAVRENFERALAAMADSNGKYLQLTGARPDGSCPSAWYGDNRLYLPPFSRAAAAILAGRVVELGRKNTSTPEQLQVLTSLRIPREPSGCIPAQSCSTT